MITFDIWIILGIIAIVLLIFFWKSKNPIWGGLTVGIIIGIVIAILSAIKGNGFDWIIITKLAIIGTLVGFIAELLGKLSIFVFKKK